MNSKNLQDLPTDYTLVLQQISEDGSNDLVVLSETLNIRRPRLVHIILTLRKKGFVLIEQTKWGESWVRLSAKGQKLVNQVWPRPSTIAI